MTVWTCTVYHIPERTDEYYVRDACDYDPSLFIAEKARFFIDETKGDTVGVCNLMREKSS